MNSVMVSNFIIALILKTSLNQIFSSINSMQIVAHLPLIDIPFGANCYFIFDILIQIMSFDFFPVADYIDMGFQATDPWNIRFEWLGYESTNFVVAMGSITIFVSIFII